MALSCMLFALMPSTDRVAELKRLNQEVLANYIAVSAH